MGLRQSLANILRIEGRATKQTGGNPQSPQYWVQKLFGGAGNTAAGVAVDEQSALTSTAVWRAVNLIAQTIGALPLHLYVREDERTSRKAVDHQLYYTLHNEPNPEQSAMEFQEMLQAHALTWGRAHAEIARDSRGQLTLWPITPDRVKAVRNNSKTKMLYKVSLPDGQVKTLLPDEIFTLRGLGYGLNHTYNVIQLFRESLGLTLAAEEFGARFFGNGATMGGVLEHPQTLGEDAYEQLRNSMDENHRGLSNSHRLLILEEGMQYKDIAVPPDKAQYLETRKFQINDVARIIGVPPHKLAEMTGATFSNIEHQAIEFVQDTINPWCVRWEQSLSRQLLTASEKRKYYFKHNLAGLLRGDFKTRMEGYSIGRQNGWLSANDIRELEDMNPVDNGDIYLIPLNMMPADQASAPPDVENNNREARSKRSTTARRRIIGSYKKLIRHAAEEIIKRERADVMRQAEKHFKQRNFAAFEEWVQDFYEKHKDFINRKLSPVLMSFAETIQADAAEEVGIEAGMTERHEAFVQAYLSKYTAKHTGRSLAKIEEAARATEPIEALEAEFDQWEETRIDSIANEEGVEAGNAFVKNAFVVGGITKLRWSANPGACEFCQAIDGKVVGINNSFAVAGESIAGVTGNSPPLTVSGNVGHPPIHKGCQCTITAGV